MAESVRRGDPVLVERDSPIGYGASRTIRRWEIQEVVSVREGRVEKVKPYKGLKSRRPSLGVGIIAREYHGVARDLMRRALTFDSPETAVLVFRDPSLVATAPDFTLVESHGT